MAAVLCQCIGHDGITEIQLGTGTTIAFLHAETGNIGELKKGLDGMTTIRDGTLKDGLHVISGKGGTNMWMKCKNGEHQSCPGHLEILTLVDKDLVCILAILHAKALDAFRLVTTEFVQDLYLVCVIGTHLKKILPLTILELTMRPCIKIGNLNRHTLIILRQIMIATRLLINGNL